MKFRTKNNTFSKENPLIIAEIGTSHNGDMDRAKKLIDSAKTAGANVVKFQIIYADEILHPNTGFVKLPTGNIPLYERFRSLEVKPTFYKELAEYARKNGLMFSASPFGFRSAKELAELKPAFIKIASPELNYTQLLEYCASFDIPIILSTGVSQLHDIERAVNCIKEKKPALELAILHCVTSYPAPENSYNVSVIKNLSNIFNIPVGLSDHSMDPILVPSLSLSNDAFIFEKHICLSREEKGLDDPVALEPQQFKQMCEAINKYKNLSTQELIQDLIKIGYDENRIKEVLGNGKKELSFAEKANYGRTNRSIHYINDLEENTIIEEKHLAILRTEKVLSIGEAPEKLDYFIGAKLQRSVKAGDGLSFDDFIKREK